MSPTPMDSSPANCWYRIDLSPDGYAGGEAEVIESAFRQIYIACNAPLGMAMLSEKGGEKGGFSIFFTPQSLPHARALVLAYSAEPQAPPVAGALTLRVGDAAAAATFFQEF